MRKLKSILSTGISMKREVVQILVMTTILTLFLIGEVKCIYKAYNCNWEPIGKAEVIYTVAAVTSFGAIVGWFDIEDN